VTSRATVKSALPFPTQTDARASRDGHAGKAGMASNGIASDALAARPETAPSSGAVSEAVFFALRELNLDR